jgi:hypothetical protein
MHYAPHKRKKSKQTLRQLLEETSALLASKYPEYRQQAKAVTKNIDMWLKHQTERHLCELKLLYSFLATVAYRKCFLQSQIP